MAGEYQEKELQDGRVACLECDYRHNPSAPWIVTMIKGDECEWYKCFQNRAAALKEYDKWK